MDEDRTVVNPMPDADATMAFVPGAAAPDPSLADRTQMAVSLQCPICYTNNPPGEVYCGDCGFLLSSVPATPFQEEEAGPQARLTAADGREFGLNAGRNTVGRQNADVLLSDGTVSRLHAVVGLEEKRCWVEDQGSTNGTSVNGQRLPPNQPRDLANGDEVSFGAVVLKVALPEGFVAAPALAAPAAAPVASAAEDSPAALVSEESGTRFPIPVGASSLGRRSANNLAFPTDPFLSGRHAEILFDGEMLILTDVGSTNGTVVNDDRIAPNTPVTLNDGDLVVLGQQRLRVRLEVGAEMAMPAPEEAESPVIPAEDAPATATDTNP